MREKHTPSVHAQVLQASELQGNSPQCTKIIARVESLPHAIDTLIPTLHWQLDICQWVIPVMLDTGRADTHITCGARRAALIP